MNNFFAGVLPQEGGLESTASWKYTAAVMMCGLLTVVGVAFGVHSIAAGHEHTFGVSRAVPWGVLIAAYVFFVVTSTAALQWPTDASMSARSTARCDASPGTRCLGRTCKAW